MEPSTEDVNYVTAIAEANRSIKGIEARIALISETQSKITPGSQLMIDSNLKIAELMAEAQRLTEHLMQLQIDWPV